MAAFSYINLDIVSAQVVKKDNTIFKIVIIYKILKIADDLATKSL